MLFFVDFRITTEASPVEIDKTRIKGMTNWKNGTRDIPLYNSYALALYATKRAKIFLEVA